jgi:hypothetical protein
MIREDDRIEALRNVLVELLDTSPWHCTDCHTEVPHTMRSCPSPQCDLEYTLLAAADALQRVKQYPKLQARLRIIARQVSK